MDNTSWKRLQKLRQSYLNAQGFLPDYWEDDQLLLAYDETLAERIRWKWRAVIEALPTPVGELPTTLIDWGCGTGGASREFLKQYPNHFKKIILLDRSSRAVAFAAQRIRKEFPQVLVEMKLPAGEAHILLVSHVLSELPAEEVKKLMGLAVRAPYLLWVESGRPQESRKLSGLRAELLRSHQVLAPCPHQGVCGMLREGQEENWCHFKAPVPREVHHSAFWRECSKQLGFDLRSLPVAYLFARLGKGDSIGGSHLRILAGSRQFKGYTRFHACREEGVIEAEFMKRHSKKIYEALADPGLDSTYEIDALLVKDSKDDDSV